MKIFKMNTKTVFAGMILSAFLNFSAMGNEVPDNNAKGYDISTSTIKTIEDYIKKQMNEGKISGLSVVIVNQDKEIYNHGFGYSDKKTKTSVTAQTLFELGSTSKAFTGLGILKLEEEGKLSLNDPVSKYIPWLKLKYKGKQVEVTLKQFMHHSSGIPFESIGEIPVAGGENALEDTVRILIDQQLMHKPGESYLYASINYDVLGLVIQTVSGVSYEEYMKNNILIPLGLLNTFLSRKDAPAKQVSSGYKIGFLQALEYNAPEYRGNTPAGYIITCTEDMGRWLKIQMGMENIPPVFNSIIDKSHIPDRTVPPGPDGASYACGWEVFQRGGGEYLHSGNNPNFSSFISFTSDEKTGVAVLSNINSAYTQSIGKGITKIIKGNKPEQALSDLYINIDNAASTIVLIAASFMVVTVCFIVIALIQLMRRKRNFSGKITRKFAVLIASILFLLCFAYCLYNIPDILFYKLPWNFVKVWGPESILTAVFSSFAAGTLFCIYLVFIVFFPKQNDRSFFTLIVLSITSGFGNAFIIFIISTALNSFASGFQSGLFIYLCMGILLYVMGQKLIRSRLIKIANNIVYSKRAELIEKILESSFQDLETIEKGKIQAGLNNDTETVSSFVNIFITSVTNVVTLLACFLYLGIINVWGLVVSIIVIILAGGLYFTVGGSARKLWEQTRDIQNIFFKFINDLIGGFKELNLNAAKSNDFKTDMLKSCNTYKEKRAQADIKFTNVFVTGELLFTIVITAVAFIFPIIFKNISRPSLISFVFVFLYMTGPVRVLLNAIPSVFQIKISLKRINDLIKQLTVLTSRSSEYKGYKAFVKDIKVELKGVEYKYRSENGESSFTVGPIDSEFHSGTIAFITGGNGSGKSTLAKLIAGLYKPGAGEIRINGKIPVQGELEQHYSAVMSDFYLFDKLYGIDYKNKADEIERYLKILNIEDKLKINEGAFSTIKLSTGQKKRLALLVSYLEDRPVYLFDEWAADQDPEYRNYFYMQLLPELKERGKCVIVITHDDRYFGIADKVIKMEMGRIINVDSNKKDLNV